MFYIGWEGNLPRSLEIDWLTPIAFILLALVYGVIGTLIGLIFLGIPATVAGLLRLFAMRGLFYLCKGHRASVACLILLTGTFMLFEASVLAVATLWSSAAQSPPGQLPTNSFYDAWLKISLISSPWLLSSLYTSWQLVCPASAQQAKADSTKAAGSFGSHDDASSSNPWRWQK